MVTHDPALVLQTAKTFSRRLFDHWEWMEEHVILGGGFFGFSLKPVAYDHGVMGGGPRCTYLSVAIIGMRSKLTSEGNAEMTLGRPPAGDIDGREFIGITPSIPRELPGFTAREITQKMHKAVSLGQCEGRFSDLFATVRGAAKCWGLSHKSLDIWFERCFRNPFDRSVLAELEAVQVEAASRNLDQRFGSEECPGEAKGAAHDDDPLGASSSVSANKPATHIIAVPEERAEEWPDESVNEWFSRDYKRIQWYGRRIKLANDLQATVIRIVKTHGEISYPELAEQIRNRFGGKTKFKVSVPAIFSGRREDKSHLLANDEVAKVWRLNRPPA